MGGGQTKDVEEQHIIDPRDIQQWCVEAEGAGVEGGQDEDSSSAK